MNLLVINGHPRKDSLSDALTASYINGAATTGAEIKTIRLAELSFDLHVRHPTPHLQEIEPDIREAQDLITWADHIVFVYPTWWGTMPALLKGFLDRVLISGYAFEEIEGGTSYAPLLRGRTAQLITTMDTPLFVYKLIYKSPGHNAMKKATLGFCGFEMAKTYNFGPVRNSTAANRNRWLEKVKQAGASLNGTALTPWQQTRNRIFTWLKAIRLQFYPMTFVAYAAGSLAAQYNGHRSSILFFWMGYAWLFFLEVATVLSNDHADYRTDKLNKYFSPFSGGSRVLVDDLLSFGQVKKGILISLLLAVAALVTLISMIPSSPLPYTITAASLFILAIGYTVPPLKLSYRSLGELTVGITHSFAVIIWGWLVQGASMENAYPWWLGLPLFFAVLPSITLSGIPDYNADRAARKKTLAVRFGKKGAAWLAMFFTLGAAAAVTAFQLVGILPEAFRFILIPVIPHAIYLCWRLFRYIKNPTPPARIDGLMVLSLTYIFWFGIIPLINLG